MHSMIANYYLNGEYDDACQFIDALCQCSRKEICRMIEAKIPEKISVASLPQYSSFQNGTTNMISYLYLSGNFGPSFVEVGRHFLENDHKNGAYMKYGENHAKLSELLGLTRIKDEDRRRVYLSDIGQVLSKKSKEEQYECSIKLSGRIPIVQYAINHNLRNDRELEEILCLYLSPSTALRRRHNIWYLISELRDGDL